MIGTVSDNRGLKRFLIYHLPAITYAALIIIVSSIPNLKAPRIVNFQFDKVAHFFEYALFALLIFRSVTNLSAGLSIRKATYLSAMFIAVFAVLDELYQHYIPGRKTDLLDLITDLLGSALVLFLLWFRRKNQNSEGNVPEAKSAQQIEHS